MQNPPPANAPASFGARLACANCGAPFTPVVSGQTLCDKCHGLAHPEPVSPLQHAEVAGFKLVHELGAGRYAHTWLAEDQQGQAVVLKLLRRYAPDPNAVQRYLAEAQRLAGSKELEHPNLARPIGAGVHLVQAFFLVYQSGGEETLADELRQRGRVLPARALEFCAQVCEGLAVIHRAGLLHLDLKPANVGVARSADGTESAVVLDFATSHLLAKAGLADAGPLPLSSAAYLSPEQAAGKPPDPRSDLYSAAVLLFQLISGRLPMMGGTADELLKAHREQPPLRLRDVGRRVNEELEALLARMLSKDPNQRPESGDEAAVMMRALIPIADTAPMEDGTETVDDPVPVVEAPRPEPEVAPPPQMLPPAVDPALERAMMGEVPPQPPAKTPLPGIPHWAAFVPPRWWPLAAGLGLIAVVTIVAMWLARPGPAKVAREKPAAPPKAASSTPVVEPPAPAAPAPPAPAPAPPAPAPAPAAAPAPAQPAVPNAVAEAPPREPAQEPAAASPPPPARKPAPPSPYAKSFDRAQKALWTGQPAGAQGILQELLRKPLSRRDKARATKMMGDVEVKKGNKAAAAGWYRKAIRLYDDPDDREKVASLIQRMK